MELHIHGKFCNKQAEARTFESVTVLQSLTTCETLWDGRGVIWMFLSQEMRHLFVWPFYMCVYREKSSVYVHAHT